MSFSLFSNIARRTVASPSAFKRSLATAAPPTLAKTIPATLHLQSGQSFTGTSFGSQKSIWGETVFSTSITSCESSRYFSLQANCHRPT
jgi:carbamoyl-phosphate synthase small subunit